MNAAPPRDSNGESPLAAVVARARAPYRVAAWLIVAAVVAFAAWAYFARLDEVAIARGEVVPQGQVKVIQHLEGGIIKDIFVAEGDRVATGDPLVRLDLTASDASREEFAIKFDQLMLARARLMAEIEVGKEKSDGDPAFPADVAQRRPGLVAGERDAFRARREELASGLGVLTQQARQAELAVRELKTKRAAAERALASSREEFAMSAALLKDKLTPKVEHLKLKREVERLEDEIKTLDAGIPRAQAGLSEAKARRAEARVRFHRRAVEELGRVELAIAQVRETLSTATDRVRRTEIKSPIDGIVKNLRYNTIGGVVRPGDALMEIVPTEDSLVIEAKLDPADIGYVRAGQPAVVKISTYDFIRYGGLAARVVRVSADSRTDPSGAPYFRVVARTDKTYLGARPGDLPITPGMQAQIDIRTGRRSVLNYLLKPVLKLKSEAFRER